MDRRSSRPLRATTSTRGSPLAAALCAITALGGCGWNPPSVLTGKSAADDPTPATAAEALSPRELIISPLTCVRRSETSEDQFVVHLAVQDGFGQPIKALGTVSVELTRPPHRHSGAAPDAPVPATSETPGDSTARWEVDLRDPEVNAFAFDGLVTKTYVLRLGGLPGGEGQPEGAGRWATVRATFTVVDAGWGEARVLTAEARVGW